MRVYGVNTVSLWPYCLGPKGPIRSIEIAKKAGFNGIQALPMKGWSYTHQSDWEAGVISYEDAFMFGPFWKAILRQLGLLGEPAPLIVDWLLFGRKKSPVFSKAIPVVHDMQPGAIVEIHPEIGTTTDAFLSFYEAGGRFCWDTLHVRREQRDGDAPVKSWRNLLEKLPADSVQLIHVHPTGQEISRFLNGEMFELTEMLQILGMKFQVPAIIEVFPATKSLTGTIAYLSHILTVTKMWLH